MKEASRPISPLLLRATIKPMKLYLSHASNYDYQTELYAPLKTAFAEKYDIYFPHDTENDGQNSKQIIAESDIMLAEASYPSTGQGIELGWAEAAGVPIVCFYKNGAVPSGAIKHVAKIIFTYSTPDELLGEIAKQLIISPLNTAHAISKYSTSSVRFF